MLRVLCYVLCGVILTSGYIFFTKQDSDNITKVIINDKIIEVEIADTPDERYQGLSGRESLCDNCGMLFVYSDKEARNYVMREMNFPLDIVFLNGDKIVKIDRDLEPEGEKPKNIYSSLVPVNYVLEVNGGVAGKNNWQVGDNIKITY